MKPKWVITCCCFLIFPERNLWRVCALCIYGFGVNSEHIFVKSKRKIKSYDRLHSIRAVNNYNNRWTVFLYAVLTLNKNSLHFCGEVIIFSVDLIQYLYHIYNFIRWNLHTSYEHTQIVAGEKGKRFPSVWFLLIVTAQITWAM